MSDTDLAAEVAELRERLDNMVDWATGLIGAVRTEGYRQGLAEGRAEVDAYEATARAQQARAGFQVIPGGRSARKGDAR